MSYMGALFTDELSNNSFHKIEHLYGDVYACMFSYVNEIKIFQYTKEESSLKKEHECAFSYSKRCVICEISYDKDENDTKKLRQHLVKAKDLFEEAEKKGENIIKDDFQNFKEKISQHINSQIDKLYSIAQMHPAQSIVDQILKMYSFEKIVSDEIRNSNEISLKRLDSMLHKINKINEIQLNISLKIGSFNTNSKSNNLKVLIAQNAVDLFKKYFNKKKRRHLISIHSKYTYKVLQISENKLAVLSLGGIEIFDLSGYCIYQKESKNLRFVCENSKYLINFFQKNSIDETRDLFVLDLNDYKEVIINIPQKIKFGVFLEKDFLVLGDKHSLSIWNTSVWPFVNVKKIYDDPQMSIKNCIGLSANMFATIMNGTKIFIWRCDEIAGGTAEWAYRHLRFQNDGLENDEIYGLEYLINNLVLIRTSNELIIQDLNNEDKLVTLNISNYWSVITSDNEFLAIFGDFEIIFFHLTRRYVYAKYNKVDYKFLGNNVDSFEIFKNFSFVLMREHNSYISIIDFKA